MRLKVVAKYDNKNTKYTTTFLVDFSKYENSIEMSPTDCVYRNTCSLGLDRPFPTRVTGEITLRKTRRA